ncbi:MAG: UDP-N-acetylglucosamine 4,6-dehydratase (inverting) [Cyclobacteriaceae bacterium]
MSSQFSGKSILITGGTGSFGQAFVKRILNFFPDIKRIVIFSRDELKQYEMAQRFNASNDKRLRFFLGDVRDKERLQRAFEGIDIVVHAAALKQVPAAEYNPMEFIKTNVSGAENIIDAALNANIKSVVALSTDKAVAPINLYGATKLCSDKLFIAANNFKGSRDINFSVVRYGNVMGSRGSVIPFFLSIKDQGKFPITDKEMTRFNISLEEGIDLVFYAINSSIGGEIYIPKIPSYRIETVAKAINENNDIEYVGIRPGEKIHEEMITASDSPNTIELDKYYIILPYSKDHSKYLDHYDGKYVAKGFSYSSGENEDWITVDEMKGLIQTHVLK